MGDAMIWDKKGIPILAGDVVKVYHFTGARRKRYYMYKQSLGISRSLESGISVMEFSHLDMTGETYEAYGPVLNGYEVVQSAFDDFEDRSRRTQGDQS